MDYTTDFRSTEVGFGCVVVDNMAVAPELGAETEVQVERRIGERDRESV